MANIIPLFKYYFIYNDFVYHVLNMLGDIVERVTRYFRKLIKPSKCFDEGKQLGHDRGSIFLFESYTIIRVYWCPQPSHILPKFVPERLGIVEFF